MNPESAIFIASGLLLGVCAGFVMHRSDFCMAGAFRDLFLFRRTFMLKCLVLYWGVAALLFEGARLLSIFAFYPFPLLGLPSGVNFVGGAVFGLGMVLAGGCVVGVLYRTGAGNAPALVAVAGMVAGSALYAEIHPAWSAFSRQCAFLPPGVATIPQLFGVVPGLLVIPSAAVLLFVSWRWYRSGKLTRRNSAEGYLQPRDAAIVLALLSLVSWIAVGMPMGITTTWSKAAAWLTGIIDPSHADSIAYYKGKGLNLVDPRTGVLFEGGPGAGWDTIAAIQVPLIAGIVGGAFLSSMTVREFAIRWKAPVSQYLMSAAGGVLMGLASRAAPACNVWHLLGGVPILAVPSLLFLLGLFPGAWAGGRLVGRLI